MPKKIHSQFVFEINAARQRFETDAAGAWHHLERAHILSQNFVWSHWLTHALMLELAIRQRLWREAFGQIVRLLFAAPGSLTGIFPNGNTGRSNVGMFTPMVIPKDLGEILSAHRI